MRSSNAASVYMDNDKMIKLFYFMDFQSLIIYIFASIEVAAFEYQTCLHVYSYLNN